VKHEEIEIVSMRHRKGRVGNGPALRQNANPAPGLALEK
jgi:hypothetical protein